MTAPGKGHNSNTEAAGTVSLSEAAYRREAKVVPGGSMRRHAREICWSTRNANCRVKVPISNSQKQPFREAVLVQRG